ncbi:MAG: sigma 54-interacting transcriptional regulator [Kiritimatiellaeota bacterium]|nr:sigma 54-interacting transcriptional regulator [Kiritimatiellota bacterium]
MDGINILLPECCTDASRAHVLITGETGTGKEMIAKLIRRDAEKKHKKFIPLNCAEFSSELMGSELFGHVKGAYTTASSDRAGILKTMADGVVFLDEIGQLPKSQQAKLLRVMESGEIRPIGADEKKADFHGRIICATNQEVEDCLIYDFRCRFNWKIHLPPLRERGTDILWFLCALLKNNYVGIELHSLLGMITLGWAGNIRGLKSYLESKSVLDNQSSYQRSIFNERRLMPKYEWSVFAGYILSLAGERLELLKPYLGNDAAMRVMGLLAYTARLPSDAPSAPVVPLKILRQSITDSTDITAFDFDFLAEILNEKLNRRFIGDDRFHGGSGNFLDALFVLRRFFKQFKSSELWKSLDASATEEVVRYGGFCSEPLIDAFLSGNRLNNFVVPAATIVTMYHEVQGADPAVSRPEAICQALEGRAAKIFIPLLDQHVSDINDRAICLLCNAGRSIREIAKELDLKSSTVHERLIRLRGQADHVLEKYLLKQRAGRKRKV